MLGIIVVLLIVILAMVAGLVWMCVTLINNRLDTPSLERFAKGYLDQMGDAYLNGFNQRVTADMIPPTGPAIRGVTDPDDWSELDKTEPHIHDEDSEDIT
jgi:hypothetical protein